MKNSNLANVRCTPQLYWTLKTRTFRLIDIYGFDRAITGSLDYIHQKMDIRGIQNPSDHRFDRYYIEEVV